MGIHGLDYRISGHPEGPWVTLSHPIGSSQAVWTPLLERLGRDFRVLTYDIRGHGRSAFTAGAEGWNGLADDCFQLWDGLGIERSHFVGLSLGGCIGVAMARRAPQRLSTLTVACSRLDMDEAAARMWRDRADQVTAQGMSVLVDAVLERWLTPGFRTAHPGVVTQVREVLHATSPAAFAHCARSLAQGQPLEPLADLPVPVQYLAGRHDTAVASDHLARYHRMTPGSRFLQLDGAHLLHLECPDEFSDALVGFFAGASA